MLIETPRWPASADSRWPSVELLESLSSEAGDVARRAAEIRQEARDALTQLTDARPGGTVWNDAREQDRGKLMNNDPRRGKPSAIEKLLVGDAARYSVALAQVSSVTARIDEQRAALAKDVLIEKIDKRQAGLDKAVKTLSFAAYDHARAGRKGPAYNALDELEEAASEIRQIVALRSWLVGKSPSFDPSQPAPIGVGSYAWYQDARDLLDGKPEDEVWSQRQKLKEHRRPTAPEMIGAVS